MGSVMMMKADAFRDVFQILEVPRRWAMFVVYEHGRAEPSGPQSGLAEDWRN
jgi:hypothetical protein